MRWRIRSKGDWIVRHAQARWGLLDVRATIAVIAFLCYSLEDVVAYKTRIDQECELILDQLVADAQEYDMGYR